MQRETYKAKSGRKLFRPVVKESEYRHLTYSENPGFCLGCGMECDGVELDARKHKCEDCGDMLVYGLEELLMMGLVRFGEVQL